MLWQTAATISHTSLEFDYNMTQIHKTTTLKCIVILISYYLLHNTYACWKDELDAVFRETKKDKKPFGIDDLGRFLLETNSD